MIKKISKKMIAMFLCMVMLTGMIPASAMAAPATDIPAKMLDNKYLDALSYTGFKVQAMKDNGTIFKTFGNQIPSSILSGITYGTGPSGLETVANAGTHTGLAPNIGTFQASGMCCASYVSYVYYNYLPNIAGVDTSSAPCPSNPRLAAAYYEQAQNWAASGKARIIGFSQNANGTNFTPNEEIPIGSLICFETISTGRISHVALYAGYYNGNHFVTHVGNEKGPTISVIDNSTKGNDPQRVILVGVPEFVEEEGCIEVQKKDTDGNNLAGAVFVATHVTNGEQYKLGPTDANGYAYVDGVPYGEYVIRETVFPKDYRSYGQTEWRVTVNASNNGKAAFQAVNEIIPGKCEIIKTSEDGKVAGINFHIKSDTIDAVFTTDEDGRILIEELKPGKYVVTEESPIEYVKNRKQNIVVETGKTTTITFHNVLKKWNLIANKVDSELEEAQGDASLAGAVYGIYHNGELVDTYTTDADGFFTTKYYVCGTGWTLQEITPSEGYLLDETVYDLLTHPRTYSVEFNTRTISLKEQVKKGYISVVKHTDDGSTQIETPEEGAEFEVYLKSSGSYEKAKETERDMLVCDEKGYAISKELPYGVYVVEQTKGWEGKELLPAFEVFVSEHQKEYPHIINNATFDAYIKVVKTDAETGKTIPYAGAGFQILRPDGSKVVMKYTYPQLTLVDTFYTNEEGTLITPEMLEYGKGYMLVEVSAPHGYVLDSTPVTFDVTEEQAKEENGIILIEVERPNMAQKGVIYLTKTGEVFFSVIEKNGCYQPVYKDSYLMSAVFEVIAAEDIYTPDGTLRYKKGEVVETIETDEGGCANTNELYLGKYEVREVKAPIGMVLNKEPITVELVYAGQEIDVIMKAESIYNQRQKVEISLKKYLETDERFGIGTKDELLSVEFGLYAAEDIKAQDGTMIPKDGLIEIATCQKDGTLRFGTDVPVGSKLYVKEVAKDERYQISDEVYYVTFDYVGQDVSVVHIWVNDGESIENKLIRGFIFGKKVNEEGKALEGAVFGLFKVGEDTFTKDNAILLATSDAQGLFVFEGVPYGNWIIRELEAPKGYKLDEISYEVTVREHGEMIEITIINNVIVNKPGPQTGDDSMIGLLLGLLAISTGGIISMGVIHSKMKKLKKKDE